MHIRETPGFDIGAAGQPPKCRNSLHVHRAAEVFFVLKGRWRFFWGRHGTAGEVVLEEGDLFDIPTGIFRGFENIGTDYGMVMAILGGNDAGGGVVWAPEVLEEARGHGLVLGENGRLYDTAKGDRLPEGVLPMPPLDDESLTAVPEPGAREVVPEFVARYWDLVALAKDRPCVAIGEKGVVRDRPGFEVEFLSRGSIPDDAYTRGRHEVLMVMRRHWRLAWEGGESVLNAGDTCGLPPGLRRRLAPAMCSSRPPIRGMDTSGRCFATGSRRSPTTRSSNPASSIRRPTQSSTRIWWRTESGLS